MKKYLQILRKCPLFNDISEEDIIPMLGCLGTEVNEYKRNEAIFYEGDSVVSLGIVLSGRVQITQTDYNGNRSIVSCMEAPQIFGESFACVGTALPVDVSAVEKSEIMFVDVRRIIKSCCNACSFHSRIIFNLLNIVAEKNLMFHRKIEITSKRTTRERLMAYLMLAAKDNNSNSFEIPYDRQGLADYLEVDRSGLSAEIGKLRREGVLESYKNHFTLHI